MRKTAFFPIVLALLFSFTGLASADVNDFPAGANAICAANSDGTGTLTTSGLDVTRVEIYHHNPNGIAQSKTILSPAASYTIPHNATFQIVFSDKTGTGFVNLDGADGADAAHLFVSDSGKSAFEGIRAVPDRAHGGIGGPGSSLACTHMLRTKKQI